MQKFTGLFIPMLCSVVLMQSFSGSLLGSMIPVFGSSVLLFVSALLVFLVLQGRAQLLDEHGQNFVQRVHHAPLQPLGNCSPGVVEAQFLQDVVHADGVDLPSCPGDEPAGKIKTDQIICAL